MTSGYAAALGGGALLGLSASLLLLVSGRIAGVSGVFSGLLSPRRDDVLWRALFVAGLVLGGMVFAQIRPAAFGPSVQPSSIALGVAGLLVGFGTRLGNGCTSGHGICGTSRLSWRSIVATITFIGAGVTTVFVTRYLVGGA